MASIDLYQWFRPLRKKLNLPHMNQSFLEKLSGWERTDQMNGAEVVSLFWSETVSKSAESEWLLLGHNHDDLIGMLRISSLEALLLLFSGKIQPDVTAEESENHSALLIRFHTILPLPRLPEPYNPLPLTAGRKSKVPESTAEDSSLRMPESPDPSHSGREGQCRLFAEKNSGELRIPFYSGTLRYYFPDYKNYCYLPLENQVVHKSLAAFVDKKYRTATKPENCFTAMEGRFLPTPSASPTQSLFAPILREHYDSKDSFF